MQNKQTHTHTPHNTSKCTAKSCVLASFKVEFSSNAAASTTAPSWDTQKILAGKTYRFSRPELLGLFSVCRHLMAPAFLLLAPHEDFGSFGIVQACSCNHFTSRPRIVGDAIRHFAQGRGCFEKTQVQVAQGAIALPGKGQLLCKLQSKLP